VRRVIGLEGLEPLPRAAVTVGKFFAVHRGHQVLLQAAVAAARREGVPAVVLTFDRHPLEVLRPGPPQPVLATLDERLELIAAQGIDTAVVAKLGPEFLSQEPEAFVRDVLLRRLGAREVLASEEFRFGRGARGDLELLRALGIQLGFRFTAVPPVLLDGRRVSSSWVGECLAAGRAAEAERLLGRPYAVPGTVERGEQLGRRLGFPTANVAFAPDRLLPADGVYVARFLWEEQGRPAVVNLGVRPTVGGRRRLLEAHLLDWDGDLYGLPARVEFRERLRGEEHFPDTEALRRQIARDAEAARRWWRERE